MRWRTSLSSGGHDFIIFPEAHCNESRATSFNAHYAGIYTMWATHFDGTEEQQTTSGGLAVGMAHTFRNQSDECILEERAKGRLLILNLKQGNKKMQVAAVYGTTGSEGPRGATNITNTRQPITYIPNTSTIISSSTRTNHFW